MRDFGHNDTMFYTRTHLGNLLNPGDHVLGYDFSSINFNESDLDSMRGRQLPDVVRYPLSNTLGSLSDY